MRKASPAPSRPLASRQAGIGFVQRVAAVIELGALGHLKFGLSVSVQVHQLLRGGASGGLAVAWQWPD